MRFFTISLGLIYSVACLAQIDTHELEAVLNSTFTEVVGYHEFLELEDEESGELVSSLKVDHEYSNFDLGRIKASLTTRTTPLESNLNEKIFFSANLQTDLVDTEDNKKSFSLNADVEILGNTLVIFKSVSEVLGECEQTPVTDESTNSEHIANIMCLVQTGINSATNVLELQTSIQEAADYASEHFGNEESESGGLIADIFSSLEIKPEGNDLVLSIKIDTNFGSGENVTPLNANVIFTIKETGITLSLNGGTTVENEKVEEYIQIVKDLATELQDRDSDTHVTYYEDNLYLVFGLLEAFLIVEDDEDF